MSKVLDSGPDGEYPPKSNHDAVLRKFVSSHYAVSHFNNTLHANDVEKYFNQPTDWTSFTYLITVFQHWPAFGYTYLFTVTDDVAKQLIYCNGKCV